MYGGSRRPPPALFQGQFGPPRQNYRPQFANSGFTQSQPNFPPQFNNIYSHRNLTTSTVRNPGVYVAWPFANPCITGNRPGFQPRAWQAAATRQEFRPSGGAEHRGGGTHKNSPGIEAYYRHSMVENPWKELEEEYKEKNENS